MLAHPDDESLGTGGILAKYATEGVETYLVMATRGERGWFGDESEYPGLEALGKIRESERYRITPLEMIPSGFRKAGHQLIERIAEFLCTLPSCPVAPNAPAGSLRDAFGTGSMPGQRAERLPPEDPWPQHPTLSVNRRRASSCACSSSPYYCCQISVLFHDDSPAIFGHTAGISSGECFIRA